MNVNLEDAVVAKKYAQAFVNVHAVAVSLSILDCFSKSASFLKKNYHIILLLSLPHVIDEQREQMVKNLVAYFSLPLQCERLFLLMILKRHSFLIPAALWYIVQIYRKRVNTLNFCITSSHDLDEIKLKKIKHILEYKTGKEITYSHETDKHLIAGLRLSNDEYIWEYSVRKHINALACSVNK